MKKVGIGMIGCGGMGRWVTGAVLANSKQLDLVGVFDPDLCPVDRARKEINPDLIRFPDVQSLVRSGRIDWVMIASWNCFHHEHVVAAARARKNVFCQKPMATTMRDALAMRKAIKESGVAFHLGFNLRYSPHYVKVREILRSGVIGDVISMEFNETLDFNHGGFIMGDWRRLTEHAGTHLLEKCCHDVDLVNWFLGSLAVRVASFGGLNFFLPRNKKHIKRLGRDKNRRHAYSTWPGLVEKNPFTARKDIVDNQVAILEYANGVRATFHTNSNAGIPERRMYILGTEGAVRADVLTGRIEVQRIGFDTKIKNVKAGGKGSHGGGDTLLARDLARTMLKGGKPRAGMDDGIKSSITCFAIDKAMESGRVVDVRPMWKKAGIRISG